MKLPLSIAIFGATVGLGMAAHVEGASSPHGLPVQEEMHWHGWAPEGQVVEIDNLFGNVRAETARGDEIEVVAIKSGAGHPEDVSIEVVEHKGGVTICAVYPNANEEHPYECRPSHGGFRVATTDDSEAHVRLENGAGGDVRLNRERVDFIVRLPKQLRFIGRTLDGEIAAHVMDQDVEAHSVRGDVSVDLDPSAGADLRAETASGDVCSDLPISVKQDREHGRFVAARIGHAHRVVRIKTNAGDIHLENGGDQMNHRVF